MIFKGTGVALVTPFTTKGDIDEKVLRKLVDYQIDNGTDFFVVQGSTGEAATLSVEEKQETLRIVIEQNKQRLPIVLGVSDNATARLTQQLEQMNYEGIDGVLSAAPHYNKPNQQGIIAHFTAVANASKKPIILYNVPGRTASNISDQSVIELAKHNNIVGVKEASGNMGQVMNILRDKPNDFALLSGEDTLTFPFITMGGNGVISVVANALPKAFSNMVHHALNGDIAVARKIHLDVLRVTDCFFEEGNPAGIKYALQVLGFGNGIVRLPLTEISTELKTTMKAEIDKLIKN